MVARGVVLALGTVLLAGCAELEAMEREQAARQYADDQYTCSGYGFRPGSDGFAGCMMRLDRDRQYQQVVAEREAEEDRRREQWKADYGYRKNGRCDDPRYRTSNGGRASPGSDEYDCKKLGLGDGRK